jgi:hypothetical protein
MNPKQTFVAEFKEAYREEFGEQISDAEALDKLTRLTNVLRIIYTAPLPESLDDVDSSEDAI